MYGGGMLYSLCWVVGLKQFVFVFFLLLYYSSVIAKRRKLNTLLTCPVCMIGICWKKTTYPLLSTVGTIRKNIVQ
ncbi:hypothetical protein B9Z19DRAFT_1091407 [Tuber borchii]|uniref:Uncharacterized protein n=1 Tax=Tuber borchii TaxID=42251 RepID=A0A2T6ZHJ6_TUBBO|nr:hypothetical protein B9Z19DRAFT_1091407 [Tuber borchii]